MKMSIYVSIISKIFKVAHLGRKVYFWLKGFINLFEGTSENFQLVTQLHYPFQFWRVEAAPFRRWIVQKTYISPYEAYASMFHIWVYRQFSFKIFSWLSFRIFMSTRYFTASLLFHFMPSLIDDWKEEDKISDTTAI